MTSLEKGDSLQEGKKIQVRELPGADFILQRVSNITAEPNDDYNFKKNVAGTGTVYERISDKEKDTIQMWMNYVRYCIINGDYKSMQDFDRYVHTLGSRELGKNYAGLKETFFHDASVLKLAFVKKEEEHQDLSQMKIEQSELAGQRVLSLKGKLLEGDKFMGYDISEIPAGIFISEEELGLLALSKEQYEKFDVHNLKLNDDDKNGLTNKDYAILQLRTNYFVIQMGKGNRFNKIFEVLLKHLDDSEKNRKLIGIFISHTKNLENAFPNNFKI